MAHAILQRLGLRIRTLREQRGISQERLGLLSGLHRTYVGAIERGERNPSVLSLEKIANALNVTVKDLFDE
jgi:XRE family transcriptional regulator, regulator of sulfur utilization